MIRRETVMLANIMIKRVFKNRTLLVSLKVILFVMLSCLLFACSSTTSILSKKEMAKFRNETNDRVYVAKNNIYSGFGALLKKEGVGNQELLFRKGEKLLLDIEAGSNYIKLRAYEPKIKNKPHIKKTVAFFFIKEDLDDKIQIIEKQKNPNTKKKKIFVSQRKKRVYYLQFIREKIVKFINL